LTLIDVDGLRFLASYERWATERILDAAAGIDDGTWSRPNVVGERGMGGILVHHLGAYQRWRNGLAGTGVVDRPEREPLIGLGELRARWTAEWAAMDAWLAGLSRADLEETDEGVPFWQCLLHLFNHGTQHRSEVAALLTAVRRSPGDLDLIDYANLRAGTEPG
jgi:uncharacterized damage-inducible protein DinB